jgi:hypothetical protein
MKKINFKRTECPKDNLVLLHKNCENCGAPLYLNKETMTCRCEYCDTEYYVEGTCESDVTLMGQIVTLRVFGVEKKFYLGEVTAEYVDYDPYIDAHGFATRVSMEPKLKVQLIEI